MIMTTITTKYYITTFIIKKIIYGVIASAFILMGGYGAQSNSTMMQVGGIVGLVIGLIVLYIFV